ncbi:hypothetical protein EDC96DRAFT_586042 [Choanephora cucurbitarum]|nr:hypothetical protein EDC96DRAFT_586042 [Choanephora cucurbitarum]
MKLVCSHRPVCLEDECNRIASSMQRYRSHLETQYSFNFPAVINRSKRQHMNEIVYITAKVNETLPDVVEYHHECPVCEFHCNILNDLKGHVYEKHSAILPPALSSSTLPTPSTSIERSHQAKTAPTKRQKPDSDDVDGLLEEEQLDDSGYTVYPLALDGHLMADEFDVSKAFHDMQTSIPERMWKYALENHIHLSLTASYILLLSPHHYPNDLTPFFTDADIVAKLRCMQSNVLLVLEGYTVAPRFKHNIFRRIRNTIINSIRKLADAALDEGLREMEQNTCFAEPFLCSLFDSPSQDVFFRWLDERTVEVKKKDILTNMRPNITITRPEAYIRHLYLFYELAADTIPNSIRDLSKLVMNMPHLFLILDVFHRLCQPSSEPREAALHRPTISQTIYQGLFSGLKRSISCLSSEPASKNLIAFYISYK